jgi:hypothetical protein
LPSRLEEDRLVFAKSQTDHPDHRGFMDMGDLFQFMSSASLEKLTGRKAYDLGELLGLVRTCPESSIFYHTFSAFLKMREVRLPYNSDFAVWVSRSVNEEALAEKLMAVDLSEYDTLSALRIRLIEIIEAYRQEKPNAFSKRVDDPFYLHDVLRIVYPTDKFAYDLRTFFEVLATISIYSIYFHFFESRLQTHLFDDDFSIWIERSLHLPRLAEKIRKIDINVHTLEGLRSRILHLIEDHLENPG